MRNAIFKAVLVGGLIGGALDLAFAVSFAIANGLTAPQLLRVIASGVFGQAARQGGAGMAGLGLLFHFLISIGWAMVFAALAQRLDILRKRPVLSGALFGVAVFFAMRLLVLPLSAYPGPVSFKMPGALYDLLSHAFLFGVPIAWMYRHFNKVD